MASPSPRCAVSFIWRRAMWPQMTAGMAVSPAVKNSATPSTIDAMAIEFVPPWRWRLVGGNRPDAGSGPAGRSAVSAARSP